MVTIVLYSPDLDQFVSVVNAVPRSALGFSVTVPFEFSGKELHAWVSMVSADGKTTSNCVHMQDILVL